MPDQVVRTPRPWVPGTEPRPEDLAQFLADCTPQERVDFSRKLLDPMRATTTCFAADHEGEIQHLSRELVSLTKQREELAAQVTEFRSLAAAVAPHVSTVGVGPALRQRLEEFAVTPQERAAARA